MSSEGFFQLGFNIADFDLLTSVSVNIMFHKHNWDEIHWREDAGGYG